MGPWRTLVLAAGLAVFTAGRAQADPIVWRWVTWTPSQGGEVITNLGGPVPFAETVSGSTAPAPAALVAPAAAATSAPAPAAAPSAAPPTDPGPPIAPVPPSSFWQAQSLWAPSQAPLAPGAQADAFINMGDGPYTSAGNLTSGGAQPWYTSPAVTTVFGGIPNAQQRAEFTAAVLQRVEQTYQQSGIPVHLTTDPNTPAAHTISVVSKTTFPANPQDAGVTTEGGNGFSFIDKFAGAQSVDQLEWVVAHNVAHELMHAFGGEHHDTTGAFLDSAVTPWSVMADPNTHFSQAAVQDLLSQNFQLNSTTQGAGGQLLAPLPSAAAEPASLAAWLVLGSFAGMARRGRMVRRRAASGQP